jgi:hypothetical protein
MLAILEPATESTLRERAVPSRVIRMAAENDYATSIGSVGA